MPAVAEAVEEEVTEIDPIYTAFLIAVDDGKEKDDLKMALIGAGATFTNVTRLYNQYMIDAGLAMGKEEIDKIVAESVDGAVISDEEGFSAVVTSIIEGSKGVTEKSASSLIRAWAKKNESECYKKEVSTGTRNPFITLFHAGLIDNPKMTESELDGIIASLSDDHQTNPKRWIARHNAFRTVCNKIAEKYEA